MACPLVKKACQYTAVIGATIGTTQYYNLYCTKLCAALANSTFTIKIAANGSVSSNSTALVFCCGGIANMYKASDNTAVTVAELPAGTVWNVSIFRNNDVPQILVQGL